MQDRVVPDLGQSDLDSTTWFAKEPRGSFTRQLVPRRVVETLGHASANKQFKTARVLRDPRNHFSCKLGWCGLNGFGASFDFWPCWLRPFGFKQSDVIKLERARHCAYVRFPPPQTHDEVGAVWMADQALSSRGHPERQLRESVEYPRLESDPSTNQADLLTSDPCPAKVVRLQEAQIAVTFI